jgi:hypothetical protein
VIRTEVTLLDVNLAKEIRPGTPEELVEVTLVSLFVLADLLEGTKC